MKTLYFAGERQHERWERHQPIDFADILEAAVILPDNHAEPPWQDDDGWKHECIPRHKLPNNLSVDDARKAAGWVRSHRSGGLIVVDLAVVKKVWMGEYSPFSGEHRQGYEERMAAARRKAILQLKAWYEDGYEVHGVHCEFMNEEASLWGIYGPADEYLEDCRREMAEDVANLLVERGLTVINKPAPRSQAHWRRERKRLDIAYHLGFENYKAYRRWVRKPCRWGDP